MIAIIARVELGASDAESYVAAARNLVAPTLEEKGCQLYGMARDICEPNVVWIGEQWDSQEDLDNHLRSDHVQAFLAQVGTMEMTMDSRQYQYTSVGPVVMPE